MEPAVREIVYHDRDHFRILATDGATVTTADDAGFRVRFEVDKLAWEPTKGWWYVAPLSMMRCGTCGVLIEPTATYCGFCGDIVEGAA